MTLSVGVSQAPARNFRWWLDADVERELALTGAQVAALQVEYDRTLERRLRRAARSGERGVDAPPDRGDLPDDAAEALVGRVEEIRRRLNIARMRLLVAMYFLLTRDQRARLPAILERRNVAEPAPCQ